MPLTIVKLAKGYTNPSLQEVGTNVPRSPLEVTNMHNTNKVPLNMHGADDLGSFQKDGGIDIPLKTANSYFMENRTFDVPVPSEMH